tara:strand:- start:199 stop:1146 length:948 start_codon:yes stop_codon:yes gene_type:complete
MKVELGTTHNINSSFTGKAAAGYMSAALLSGKSLASGAIDIRDNIQYKEVIQVLSSDANLIQSGVCDFDPSGTLNTTEIVLEPKEIMVNLEVCAKNYRSGYESLQMKGINSKMPQNLGQFILEHVVQKTAAGLESAIWTGTTAGNIPFDGFEVLAAANADVIDVAKAAITATNVTTELGKVVDAIPSTIYGKEDLYIYVSTAIYQAFVRSLGGFGAANSANATTGVDDKMSQWYRNQQELYFDGIKLISCPGLTSTDMFATTSSNLIFGTSLFSELNQSSIIDMGPIDGSQNSRVILRGSAGVALGIGSEVVFYS